MRNTTFNINKYYYLCGGNKENDKLFFDDTDRARFLFLILHMVSPTLINNTSYYINSFIKKRVFNINKTKLKEVVDSKYIDVISFCITRNQFHILVRPTKEGAVSIYMHRILTSYSRYFNSKYKRVGHVFDGPYKASRVSGINGPLHISAYIHKGVFDSENCNCENYIWSSFTDFINENRWGNLLNTNTILRLVKNKSSYKNFVLDKKRSTAEKALF